MVKRISMLVFACLLVASFSFAAETATKAATPSKTTTSTKSSMTKVSGTVDKIDAKAHTLAINTGTETKTVSYGSKTSYVENGKKVKSTELKSGQKVDVWTDSKNMARKVDIEPANTMTH
jgi:Cu/Ag efflux protein CusF